MSSTPSPTQASEPIIRVENLTKFFSSQHGFLSRSADRLVKAVDGVSFDIFPGETLGLVGESGCGKTTVGRTLLQLYPPTGGKVFYKDIDLAGLDHSTLRRMRSHFQMIFQDPYSSLNPRWTIGRIIGEPLRIHAAADQLYHTRRVAELLDLVQLDRLFLNRYPHECSGGQRQRVGIARALASRPDFIVCDEPISALDVSIQAQIVNLLEDLQSELNLTYLFIGHDLSMLRHICDRLAVMYLGAIIEIAVKDEIYTHPLHPYTQALISSISIPDPLITRARKRIVLSGEPPDPMHVPGGCRFHPRCPIAGPECKLTPPAWRQVVPDHWVACHKV